MKYDDDKDSPYFHSELKRQLDAERKKAEVASGEPPRVKRGRKPKPSPSAGLPGINWNLFKDREAAAMAKSGNTALASVTKDDDEDDF